MFSLTLLVSNLGFLKRATSVSFISVPILCGYFFSSEGFFPILPSVLEGLSWALRVALIWVTFIAGTRIVERPPSWQQVGKLTPFFFGYLIFFALVFLMAEIFLTGTPGVVELLHTFNFGAGHESLAIALILSSALFSS